VFAPRPEKVQIPAMPFTFGPDLTEKWRMLPVLLTLLFSLNIAAAADDFSLADFPAVEANQRCAAILQTTELAAIRAEDFRKAVAGVDLKRAMESVRQSYPENLRFVQDWKTKAREALRIELEAKGVKKPDLFARSIVNKVQNEIRIAEENTLADLETGTAFNIIRSGMGGSLGKNILITEDACVAARKDIFVSKKLAGWVEAIEKNGLLETRKIKGYHDEKIQQFPGVRSIRLNGGVRATYEIGRDGKITIIGVGKDLYDH
jgi:hypothetical protein